MSRTEKIEIRLTPDEKAAISYVADRKKLPPGTLARQVLLLMVEAEMPVQTDA